MPFTSLPTTKLQMQTSIRGSRDLSKLRTKISEVVSVMELRNQERCAPRTLESIDLIQALDHQNQIKNLLSILRLTTLNLWGKTLTVSTAQ
jgi:hypothetical protein